MNIAPEWSTLVNLLQGRAEHQPGEMLYTFLIDGEDQEVRLTYGELDRQARSIAACLRARVAPGSRALLLYQPGLEFISAFFGCLYAGLIAVPAYPPRNPRHVPRIQTIVHDAEACLCLTSSTVQARSRGLLGAVPGLEGLAWLATDQIPVVEDAPGQAPGLSSESVAYLQYTSGSTSEPKGVMVSHANLLHNLGFLCDGRGHTKIVSWLPLFHDMGLIYSILQGLYGGFPCILMAPASFLQRPVRWLQALSRFRASTAIAPNFAYELCVQKITEDEKRSLDLSCWTMALNAAEPVRGETLARFAQAFATCGFRAEFLKPAYGLAEATLGVSIHRKSGRYWVKRVDKTALSQHRISEVLSEGREAATLIGCGQGPSDQIIAIVDPETMRRCQPGVIGEIWLASPSVAQGYWKKPKETEETFRARVADTGEGPFLRTGDLGCSEDGDLFVTGRLKDMIIVRGVNHYPQDIEGTAQKAHPALQPDASAAFSVDVAGEEKLVVVAELIRHHKADLDQVVAAVRESIAEEHGVQIDSIVLVRPLNVPKTSSGKIQRRLARQMFLEDQFGVERAWRSARDEDAMETPCASAAESDLGEPRPSLSAWLLSRLSHLLGIPTRQIDPRQPFSRSGLDSMGAVTLTGELERRLDRSLPPSLLFDYPSVEAVVRHLTDASLTSIPGPVQGASPAAAEPIAVIGLGCRFPGANHPGEFWDLLCRGVDAISEVPADRWDVEAFYDPKPATPGKMNTRWGGFLKNVDLFDADFFEISPREARQMDPQQRLLLEVAWEALEDAGIPPARLAGSRTGVFVGLSSFDYWHLQLRDWRAIDAYGGTGVAHSVAANRISYFLDLKGPSLAIDTACSSSLVAIHQACESLRHHETDLALVGGVNLILTPELTIALSQARMMAADGRCKTFDSRADGYVRGEGCGVVVLKRLSDARRDGDLILASVQGTAVNQDGRSNGLTAPNGPAQEAVIAAALRSAGLTPSEIGYVECHGTGTALGDPQEVEALRHVLGEMRAPDAPCWIGSVKTNIGHLEAAAGLAGFIKVVLALRHGAIPPHLHLRTVNPQMRIEQTPFQIPDRLIPWPARPGGRCAGLSSFGFGGTNAHLILAEAPEATVEPSLTDRPLHLLALSAKNAAALERLAGQMSRKLDSPDADLLANVCYAANTGRTQFDHRLAVVAESSGQAREALAGFKWNQSVPPIHCGRSELQQRPRVAFLFTGQGSQYAQMGRVLFETQPTFRRLLEQSDEILRPQLGRSLASLLFPKLGEPAELNETIHAQPALFALEYALAELWRSWGIQPDAVVGHSLGEYVAACIAGVFDLESGLRLAAARARLMGSLPRVGRMAALLADVTTVADTLAPFPEEISIAAVNGPGVTVISGKTERVQQVVEAMKAQGIGHQMLAVSHAFHSPLMDPILGEFKKTAQEIRFQQARIPLISNLTGDWLPADAIADAKYWTRHLREPVQFARGMATLFSAGMDAFLECGPAPVLCGLGKRCLPAEEASPSPRAWLASLKKGAQDWPVLLDALGQLYARGAAVNWKAFDGDYARRRVSIPSYPFERTRHWVKAEEPRGAEVDEEIADDPAWKALARSGEEAMADGVTESALENETKRFAVLNELSEAFILRTLGEKTAFGSSDSPAFTLAELVTRLRVTGRFSEVVPSWLQALVRAGRLRKEGPSFNWDDRRTPRSVEVLWTQVSHLWAGEPFFPELVRRCGEHLPEVIRGVLDPLTLLFPNGSGAAVESIYRDSTVARHFNRTLSKILTSLAETRGRERPWRILEVGGGTGGTTAHLLPELAATPAHYVFTDVGPTFVQQAQAKFKEFAFVTYRILDLENSPEAQGFDPGSFDVVIAANVLHATRRIHPTLERLRSLLASGGHLLIWEATERQSWLDVTFGLLEGWQRFADKELRPHHPLLSASEWLAVLRATGFRKTKAFPEADRSALGQSVIVAQAGIRHSVPSEPRRSEASPTAAESNASSAVADLFYEVRWQIREVRAASPSNPWEGSGTWLLFGDNGGVADRLARVLVDRGEKPILVWPADHFEVSEGDSFRIDPGNPSDWERLFEQIVGRPGIPPLRRIVHAWSLNAPGPHEISLASLEDAPRLGCESVVQLLHQLASPRLTGVRGAALWLVTRGSQVVAPTIEESSAVAQAPLWGLAKVIALECPHRWGGIVDLDPAARPDETNLLWRVLTEAGRETQWGIRHDQTYVPRLVRPSRAVGSGTMRFKANATYLITGGLGGMGLKVAGWMVERGARRLLLVNRTPLPERKNWEQRIQASASDASRIRAILELEQRGASIHLAAVDVANEDKFAVCLREFQAESWPPIRGVIHAAGILDDRALIHLDGPSFDRVMRPTVIGGWLLHRLLRDAPLDFFVLFSSAASILGSAGQGNHAAASAFLDSLAGYRRARSLPAQSINWGPWGEVGAAAHSPGQAQMTARGVGYLTTDLGLAALEVAMARNTAQSLVIAVDWPKFIETGGASSPMLEEWLDRKIHSQISLPGSGSDRAAGRTGAEQGAAALETQLKGYVAALLMQAVNRVDAMKPLIQLGFDSLMAVQLQNEIEANLGCRLPLNEMVHSSLHGLARRIAGEPLEPPAGVGATVS